MNSNFSVLHKDPKSENNFQLSSGAQPLAHRVVSSGPQGSPGIRQFGGQGLVAALIAATSRAVAINAAPAALPPNFWTCWELYGLDDTANVLVPIIGLWSDLACRVWPACGRPELACGAGLMCRVAQRPNLVHGARLRAGLHPEH